MASASSDRDALAKLLQMSMVAEYQSEFDILINRVTEISLNLLKSFYISGLKLALQLELLRSKPTTLGEAFSLARIAEAHFEDERPTIAIAKPNDLTVRVQVRDPEQTNQGRGDEPNRILLVTIHHMLYHITVEVLHQVFSPHGYIMKVVNFEKTADIQFSNLEELQVNQDENMCTTTGKIVSRFQNGANNTKPPLYFVDTFGNNGGDDSETSGPVTPVEVVDSGHNFV
ncbi:polypyrimidine tract-binding protein homolog 3 [Tanacetum coccineum]